MNLRAPRRFRLWDIVKVKETNPSTGRQQFTRGKIGTIVELPDKDQNKIKLDFDNGGVGWYTEEEIELWDL
jgi:phage pi2 protein 07